MKMINSIQKLNRKHRMILTNVSLVIVATIILWTLQVYHIDVNRSKERALLNAQVYADDLSKDFQRGVSISETLKVMLIDNNGEIHNFNTVAKNLMEDYIGSIQLAPNGVVTNIYPLSGNEAGMIDLLNDPIRGPVSEYAKAHDEVTMQGPFDLAQGGQGIAIRTPVFVHNDHGGSDFWGFTIVIIKSPQIFDSSLHALNSFGYDYTLDVEDKITRSGTVRVTGTVDPDVDLTDPAIYTFIEGGNTWTISVEPTRKWSSRRALWTALSASVLGLLVIVLSYMFMSSQEQQIKLQELAKSSESANDAKTAFLSNMAHDIRTPLNAVIGLSNLAEKNINDTGKLQYYLDQIGIAGNQLLNIINSILEITRIESKKVEIVETITDSTEIYDGLQTIFQNQARANHLRFNFSNNIQHRYVYADRTHIEEILVNLVSNAMKYTPDDGCVDVSFSELPGIDDEHIIIRSCVKDNGIGMSEEYQKKMFEKFERENNQTVSNIQGTGLGLSIVKLLVDMMGGTIAVTSRQGLGTLMTVEIPHRIAETPSGCADDESCSDNSIFVGKKILLAEDNEINAMIAEEILKESGFIVDTVSDGRSCVAKIREQVPESYDLILMDINMPEMDGYEATSAIRSLEDPAKSQITIIAMTANAFEEDKIRVKEAGMNDHIAKPINLQELYAVLRKSLKNR